MTTPRYRKMVQGIKKRKGKKEPWFLYILQCGDGSFYTGITKDIEGRVKKHNTGKGAAYTRSHLPVALIYQEPCRNRGSALVREMKVKALSRKEKERLAGLADL